MRILSLDTSTDIGSVALLDNVKVIAETIALRPMNQLNWLARAVKNIIHEAGWKIDDIDGIAVAYGPGSFTGLRIAVATAKAIVQTRRLPLVGISTLDALAYNALSMHGAVCAVMRSRVGEVFAAFYKSDGIRMVRTGEFLAESYFELVERINIRGQPVTLVGDAGSGKKVLLETIKVPYWWLPDALGYPKASHVGYLAYISGEFSKKIDEWAKLEPLYLKGSAVKEGKISNL